MNKEMRIKLLERLKEITRKEEYKYINATRALSDKQRQVIDLCKQQGIVDVFHTKLLSILLDFDMAPHVQATNVYKAGPIGTVMIPLTTVGGHNYAVNCPVILLGQTTIAIKIDGTIGNNLTMSKADVRFAKPEEIDLLMDVQLDTLADRLLLL